MNEEEKSLLLEISELYKKLKDEPNGTYSSIRGGLIKPDGNSYVRNANSLKEKVENLFNTFAPEYLDEETLRQFIHTCNKEVGYVEYHYDKQIKPRSSKKAYSDFIRSMDFATHQIEINLSSLFNRIDEIRNE